MQGMCPEEKGTRPSTAIESYAITGSNLFHLNVTIQVIVEKKIQSVGTKRWSGVDDRINLNPPKGLSGPLGCIHRNKPPSNRMPADHQKGYKVEVSRRDGVSYIRLGFWFRPKKPIAPSFEQMLQAGKVTELTARACQKIRLANGFKKSIPSTPFMASFHRDALVNDPILVDSSSGHIWRLAVLHLDWSYLSIGPVHLWSHLGCCDPAGREALGLSTHTSYELWVSHLETLGSMWPKSNSWWVTYDATCIEAYKHCKNPSVCLNLWRPWRCKNPTSS